MKQETKPLNESERNVFFSIALVALVRKAGGKMTIKLEPIDKKTDIRYNLYTNDNGGFSLDIELKNQEESTLEKLVNELK